MIQIIFGLNGQEKKQENLNNSLQAHQMFRDLAWLVVTLQYQSVVSRTDFQQLNECGNNEGTPSARLLGVPSNHRAILLVLTLLLHLAVIAT